MVSLFDGKSDDTLPSLRHFIFTKKVSTAKAFVTTERLPLALPAIQEAFIVKEWTFKSWYGWGW
jgi:hypothetical protein